MDQFVAVPYEPDEDARLALAGVGVRDDAANDLFRVGDDLNVGTGQSRGRGWSLLSPDIRFCR
jgi:hypothetical protein